MINLSIPAGAQNKKAKNKKEGCPTPRNSTPPHPHTDVEIRTQDNGNLKQIKFVKNEMLKDFMPKLEKVKLKVLQELMTHMKLHQILKSA